MKIRNRREKGAEVDLENGIATRNIQGPMDMIQRRGKGVDLGPLHFHLNENSLVRFIPI